MKTLNLPFALLLIFLFTIQLTISASKLEFRLKINEKSDQITIEQLSTFAPIRVTTEYTEVGSYDNYLVAMKQQNSLEALGYHTTEIVAFYDYLAITIDDAFILLDNRNEQDQHSQDVIFMSEEEMDIALKNVQNEDFYYTVQIGIFNENNVNQFFDFPKSIDETITPKGYYRYSFGKFYTMNDAKDALKMMKEYQFENAEIIAFDNLERIPLTAAIQKEERRLEQSLAMINPK